MDITGNFLVIKINKKKKKENGGLGLLYALLTIKQRGCRKGSAPELAQDKEFLRRF